MRIAIIANDAVESKVRLLKVLLMVWVLQAAVVTASAQRLTLITPTNTTWRYFTNGTDPGAEWALPAFDDSAWPQGRGLFGNENNYPYPIATFIPGQTPITVYYRTHFHWVGGIFGVGLAGTNYVDDGSIIYLNGVELARFNMPPGPAAFDTLTPTANPGGFPNVNGGEPVLVQLQVHLDGLTNGNANPLITGDNVIAVEVHQNSSGSSDRVFGLSLFAGHIHPCATDNLQPTNRTVLERRSTTFVVVTPQCFPPPTLQWHRNVGFGEELISGATSNIYTLTNAMKLIDEGVYYCRLTSPGGTVDSRQALLTIFSDGPEPPTLLSASVVGPGLHTFRLITDEELCGNANLPPEGCGTDFTFWFNWQILQADNPSIDLGVVTVIQINPTTYEFITVEARDPTKQYQITVTPAFGEIGDRFNNRVPPGTFAQTPFLLTFQRDDANGYGGTQEATVHSNATADTPLGARAEMRMDLDDAGVSQGLLRFDNLFGMGTNHIPYGSRIVSATLTLNQIDPGSPVNLHRMLADWNQSTVTWNGLVDGVSANDVEARNAPDATKPVGTTNGPVDLDVTASVQAWLNGQPNYGWALLPTGADGWTINTSESGAATAPMLTVAYEGHIDVCQPAITLQPPASITPAGFQTVIITVGVTNTFFPIFQWTKNGVDIPGANQTTYVIQFVTPLDSGTYRLRMSCGTDPSVFVLSDPCVLVLGHPSRPRLTGAAAESDGVTVTLRFSEPLNEASAENLTNYSFEPPLTVLGAVYSNGYVLLTTSPRESPANYVLRIADVTGTSTGANSIDPNPTFATLTSARILLPWAADGWHYNTNNLDTAPDWKNPGLAPGPDWGTGRGLFGAESSGAVLAAAPAAIATPLTPNSVPVESERLVTTYFRKTIDLPPLPTGTRYVICHYTDDGFIAYLDGAEIHRFAMPAGAVTFTNRSTGIPNGEATYRSFGFDATPGTHTLAVELHQAGLTSSDVLFGMEVRMIGGTSPTLSIGRSGNGDVYLNWNTDGNWRLRYAATLSGPYLDVSMPFSSRLGTYTLPSASVTNRSFWLLDYTGNP